MAAYQPSAAYPGGFTPQDGTIDFYLRVQSYLRGDMTVLDLGAGRAAWFEDDASEVRRWVRDLCPRVKELIGADTDPAVMENRSTCRNVLIENGLLPLEDATVDLIVSDFVLEHIPDPDIFVAEISRVLKPGGVFCARTPHSYNYVSLAARLINNASHSATLRKVQPDRNEIDVFPTYYKLNTPGQIRRAFADWDCSIVTFRAEPAYFGGSHIIYLVMKALHHLMPSFLIGNLFVFSRKADSKTRAHLGSVC